MRPLPQPRLSQFGPAIAWLMQKEVSADRLAALFGTTPGNIRVVAYRGRQEAPRVLPNLWFPEISVGDQPGTYQELGIRSVRDKFILARKGAARRDWLEDEIAKRYQIHAAQYRYREGIESLRELLPHIGYPADARRL